MPIRYLLILGAFLISMLMWIDRACIAAAEDNIAQDLNLTPTQMGWVMGAFALGYALFQVPGGKLADRFETEARAYLSSLAVQEAMYRSAESGQWETL